MTARQTILVIDDDADFRAVVTEALRQRGFEVLEATNGEAGVEMANAHLPDLVISDVNMDRKDGYGVLACLRENSRTAGIPFILMTGLADEAGMRRGMEQGADDYLPKPFTIGSLYATVEARLRKQIAFKQRAEEKLDELRVNLSRMLPHELNTPLVGILGVGDMIVSNAAAFSPDELREMGQMIVASAGRLRRLIEKFLLHARLGLLEANPQEVAFLRQRRTNQAEVCVAEAAQKEAEGASRLSDLLLAVEETSVCMSQEFLTKIVEELVNNAFKFSSPGAVVEVALRPQVGGWVVLTVIDRGRGMKSEQIAEIGAYSQFERQFYEQQGPGLGLYLAKRLAELHGGKLAVHSEPGVGTAVTVRLGGGAAEGQG
jgi:signal transduction histidine kinase